MEYPLSLIKLTILIRLIDLESLVLKDSCVIYCGLILVVIRKLLIINGKIIEKENVASNLGLSQQRRWLETIT